MVVRLYLILVLIDISLMTRDFENRFMSSLTMVKDFHYKFVYFL